MKQPNFIIVGAAKAGTTSLHQYLNTFDDIYLPSKKELWYLQLAHNPNQEIRTRQNLPISIETYSSYFNDATTNQLLGEATPSYLLFPHYTLKTIQDHFEEPENTKIIIVLREPLDKILSLYRFNLKIRTEHLSLEDALKREKERFKTYKESIGFNYRLSCEYSKQISVFTHFFKRVKIILFNDLKNSPEKVIAETREFLDLPPIKFEAKAQKFNKSTYTSFDPQFAFDFIKYFKNSVIKRRIIASNKAFFKYIDTYAYHDIPHSVFMELKRQFLQEAIRLESLYGLNLEHWKVKYRS